MIVDEIEQLTALCVRLGAPPTQASVMARQLLKRAAQIAAERKIDPTTALAQLIEVVIKGRNGEPSSAGFPEPKNPE